jgi:hypothetical protein
MWRRFRERRHAQVSIAQHVVEILDFVCQHMQLGREPLYLGLCAAVDRIELLFMFARWWVGGGIA